jgi:deoxyadenosine/deoxycytidine kinase
MIVTVDGNISSGKSTVVERLGSDHAIFQEPLEKWTLLDKFYADPRTYVLPFSLQVLAAFAEVSRPDGGLVVTERSPLTTREVFTRMHVNDGTMNDADWQTFKRYFDIVGWKPDAIVFVHVPFDVCHRRMLRRNRSCEENVTLDYLERVEKSYETLLRFANIPYEIVDGTASPDVVEREVRDAIRRLTSSAIS